MTEPTWSRLDLFRKRLERQCGRLLADAVRVGDVELIRSHRIRLAALHFAFEGSVEAHRQLAAFYSEDHRPLNDADVGSILAIVGEPGVRDDAVLGVVNPSPDDAKEFVFHLSAFVWALQNNARFGSTTAPRAGPRGGSR